MIKRLLPWAMILASTPCLAATFVVTNTYDSGPGSLRQAILDGNANAGLDTIAFAIPGPGVHTIAPLSPLPALDDNSGAVIDGYTQPGSSRNTLSIGDNAVLLVELSGAAMEPGPFDRFGLSLRSSSNVVRGLAIGGFGALGSGEGALSIETGSDNVVTGCFLGTDPTGLAARPNEFGVIVAQSEVQPFPLPSRSRIGGPLPSERNVISGNFSAGVVIGVGASETSVAGNYIGTDSSGATPLGNGGGGLALTLSWGTLLGGASPGSGNVISGNVGSGIFLIGAEVTVAGNRIGTNAAGSTAVPNGTGIQAFFPQGMVIGGTATGAGNLISGNTVGGIRILFPSGTRIEGNLIGTGLAGAPLGNGQEGVLIRSGTDPDPAGAVIAGNVVAFNGASGVVIGVAPDNGTSGNRISGNSIHDNGGLGIDLGADGVTPALHCGAGLGPNLLQNPPVVTSAETSLAGTTIRGTLDAAQGSAYLLEFFSNPACDASGFGEGKTFLGTATVTTDSSCSASFDILLPVGAAAGSFVTATATDASGNTSEFSGCQGVVQGPNALTGLSAAKLKAGLKNSDDTGTRFDWKAEVMKNGVVIGSGELDGASGGGAGFQNSVLDQVPLTLLSPASFSAGDRLQIHLSVRVAATGHRSGTARLWFNDAAADSRFGAMIGGGAVELHLLDGFRLEAVAGTGPKRTIDVFVDRAAGGNPFRSFGTWTKTF